MGGGRYFPQLALRGWVDAWAAGGFTHLQRGPDDLINGPLDAEEVDVHAAGLADAVRAV